MEQSGNEAAPRWLSISGQPLTLDFESGYLGQCVLSAYHHGGLMSYRTVPIDQLL